jgi:polygalacturonase
MVQISTLLGLLATSVSLVAASPVAAAAPEPTAAPNLENRATTCTFTNAASASKSKKSCATIVLSGITVPSGTTLDMTGLNSGTHVVFAGKTTFGYEGISVAILFPLSSN